MRATKCLGSLAMTAFRPSNHCPGMMSRCPHTPKFGPQFAANGWELARALNGAGVGGEVGRVKTVPIVRGSGGWGRRPGPHLSWGKGKGHYTPVVVIPPGKITR